MKPRDGCISVVSTETTMPASSGSSAYSFGYGTGPRGEPRRLVADHAHAVSEEVDVVVVLRARDDRLGGGVDLLAERAGADRLHRRALDGLDLAEQVLSSASGSPWIAMRQTSPI